MVIPEKQKMFERSDIVVNNGQLTLAMAILTAEGQLPSTAAAEHGFAKILGRKYMDRYIDPVPLAIDFDQDTMNIGSCLFREKGGILTSLRPNGRGGLEPAGTEACRDVAPDPSGT
jgi:hypothetical protein